MHRQGMMMMMMGRSGKRRSGRRWLRPAGLAAWCCAVAIGFAVCLPCRADITTTGSIYDVSGTYRVGNTADGSLLIDSGSQLSRTSGYIGYNSGSSGTATVSGPGSMWANLDSFYVGSSGAGSLTVQDGGQVSSYNSYLGDCSGSSGTATVSGTESRWTSRGNLYVGFYGTGSLTVQDGGQVSSSSSYVAHRSGSSGTAVVSGTGSTWTSTGGLCVGYDGAGSLIIQDGGQVSNLWSYLGYNSGSSGTAVVSGMGSTLTIAYSLHVGDGGTGTLTVQDGGLVSAATLYASLGDLQGNGIITANGGVLDADVVFDADHGLSQTIAFGSGGSLNLSISASCAMGAGYKTAGTLRIADGRTVTSSAGYLGYYSGSSGTAVVSGAGSTWTTTDNLYVGKDGTGSLTVQDGGQVSAGALYASLGDLHGNGTITASGGILDADIVFDAAHGLSQTYAFGSGGSLKISFSSALVLGAGYKTAGSLRIADGRNVTTAYGYVAYHPGSSGTAVVSGMGSRWTCNGTASLYVGYYGTGSLAVQDGGRVSVFGSYLGYNSGSSGAVVVSGTGSMWTLGELNIGHSGTGSLIIQDGGQVSNSYSSSYLGCYSGSSGTAVVSGTDSRWTASGLTVGLSGTGWLSIQGAGRVSSYASAIGSASVSNGTAVVTGTGSTWTSTTSLYVGGNGTGSLTIQDGGQVSSSTSHIGYNFGSSGTAVVSGTGATWTSTDSLYVGNNGTGSLTIQDGGQVSSSTSHIGYNFGSSGTAVVGGTGSTWTSALGLQVGSSGTGSLTIQDGGQVSSSASCLGYNSGSNGTAVVSGAGSRWTSTSGLSVGRKGTGSLTIQDGGQVSSLWSYIGALSGSNGTAVVRGTGSTWTWTGGLWVGEYGTGSLSILDGAQTSSSSDSYLGYDYGSSGAALVSGTGARWTSTSNLYVGYKGKGSLTVQDGGQVSSSVSYVGYYSSSTAVVSGTGSTWISTGSLYVQGGSLTILDGGQVSNSSGYIGPATGSGTVVVIGTGSTWTSTGSLSVQSGSLTILDGGQVSSSSDSSIGHKYDSSEAVVSGTGSTWTISGKLTAGSPGIGRLTVADGGKALAGSVTINSQSAMNLRVSGDGMVVLGNPATAGSIANYGKVNFHADAFLAAGTYRPITEYAGRATTWSGLGSYNATGGAWDTAAKTFIVQPAVQVASGVVAAVGTGQRLLITDAASGKRVGASFPTVLAGRTLRANVLGDAELSALALGSGEYVLAAWNFYANFSGGSALLAFDVGIVPRPIVPAGGASVGGASAATDARTGGLKTYRLDGSSWALLPAGDFIYAETGIASFTTSVFGRFAITAVSAAGDADRDGRVDDDDLSLLLSNWNQPAGWTAGNFSGDDTVDDDDLSLLLSNWTGNPAPAVPEPATLAILALGVVGMLRRRRASSGNR